KNHQFFSKIKKKSQFFPFSFYQKVVENIFDLKLYNKHVIFSYFFCILNRYKTGAVSADFYQKFRAASPTYNQF
ncbi:hypothetical protein WDU94_011675, partial [Cyamophila willieti]